MTQNDTKRNEQPPKKMRKTDSNEQDRCRVNIDDSFYSRQLYVLGRDAMTRMASSHILISGLGGLGVEIAKNIILAGVRSVTLHDISNCSVNDLSSQYYLGRADLGKNRALASCPHLAQLNAHVITESSCQDLTEEFIKSFRVVVLTESSLQEQLRISSITHDNDVALVVASCKGLFGQVFCDFGEGFEVVDATGEKPATAMIASISRDSQGIVKCVEGCRHGLQDGDFVTFSDIKGMNELNFCEPKEVHVLDAYSFSIGDTKGFTGYTSGGVFTQVLVPKTLNFKPFLQALADPEFVISDSGKPDHSSQLHAAFRALHIFEETHNRNPHPWNEEDASEFLEVVRNMFVIEGKDEEISFELMGLFSKICTGNFCPINAIIGGIVGQEVMKACSGKFTPIYQWLYFDAVECLPETRGMPEVDYQPTESRYDGQIAVFGRDFQNRLGSLNYFVVGAGAVGCEVLKNLAMMGVGDINRGSITISDFEMIEKSNLNRQFLFRSQDVRKPKSITASEAIRRMNLNVNVSAHDIRAGPETENIFDDAFFESLDGVVVALDNVESRNYVDRRCVYFRKPLLEAGTLGTKGSTQVVVPFLTQNYSSSWDLEDRVIPFFTLKHHPYTPEHAVMWARDIFEGLFKRQPDNAVNYLENPKFFDNYLTKLLNSETFEILQSVKGVLIDERPQIFEDCVVWARNLWEDQFSNKIKQLLHIFPPESNQQFWAFPKRCPKHLQFSADEPLHLDFVFAAANLIAAVYNIPQNRNREFVAQVVKDVIVKEFVPGEGMLVNGAYRLAESDGNVNSDRIVELLYDLPPRDEFTSLTLSPLEFDKDDDSNFHLDFIFTASNLRAANYGLRPVDRLQSRLIAGDLTPAIATTSSVVAGLLALELVKLTQGFTTLQPYKNGFFNLSLPFLGFSKPLPSWTLKYNDTQWTVWDRFEVDGELTLEEFIDYFRDRHRLRVYLVHRGACILFSEILSQRTLQELRGLPMSRVLCKMADIELALQTRYLNFNIFCYDFDGKDVEVPHVRYSLPAQSLNMETN